MKILSTLALTTAAFGFAATASAGDCSTKKTQKTAQYTSIAPQTAVLGAQTHGATVQTVGYQKTADIETVSGDTLTAVLKDGVLFVKDENGGMASVAITDIKKSNGVVHVVNSVLLPASNGAS